MTEETIPMEDFPPLDKTTQKKLKQEEREARNAFGPKRRSHGKGRNGMPAAMVWKPYTWAEEKKLPSHTFRRPQTKSQQEHREACAVRTAVYADEDWEEVELEDYTAEEVAEKALKDLEDERLKNAELAKELEETKIELVRTQKELEELKETKTNMWLMKMQNHRKNLFLSYVKFIILLQTLASNFSSDISVRGFGSGVRKMFEFLATPMTQKEEYGSPFIRDFDICIKSSPEQFRLVRNYLEALIVNSKGMLKGFPFVFADITVVQELQNTVQQTKYLKFSMMMYDSSNKLAVKIDVSSYQEQLGDDFDVNSFVFGKKGIFTKGCDFFSTIWDVLHRQATPKFNVSELNVLVEKIPRILKLNSSGYKFTTPIPKLELQDCPISKEKSICISFSGCNCSQSRPINVNYLPDMLKLSGGHHQIRCYYCRTMFEEYSADDVRNIRLEIPENPFIFPDMKSEYEKLRKNGLKNMTDFWFRDGVFLDGKKVGLRHFEEIQKWIRGETPREAPDLSEAQSSNRPRLRRWRDLFWDDDDCPWFSS